MESDDRAALQCAQSRYPVSEPMLAARPKAAPLGGSVGVALATRPRVGGALLRFALTEGADVRLQVFDVSGRLLTTLVDGYRPAGEHEVAWDGGTATGRMPSGVYFARVQTPVEQARATVILVE
ncbi:MAG: FlgD immunoglobulin-like domain containing protein [Candidatus Eiseniibacteriota bacterium]